MRDATNTPTAPTSDELQTLYRRAEKVWLERVIEAAETGGNGVNAAEVLRLLTQAQKESATTA